MKAIDAIEASRERNEIIHLGESDITEDDTLTLLSECTDHTDTQHGAEYWGSGWRVHIDREGGAA